jgi:hypothetical protein
MTLNDKFVPIPPPASLFPPERDHGPVDHLSVFRSERLPDEAEHDLEPKVVDVRAAVEATVAARPSLAVKGHQPAAAAAVLGILPHGLDAILERECTSFIFNFQVSRN